MIQCLIYLIVNVGSFAVLEILFAYFLSPIFFKLAGGERFSNRLRTASPQGIDAQASQGNVAPLTERSDETFSVGQFFLCRPGIKLRRTHDTLDRRV